MAEAADVESRGPLHGLRVLELSIWGVGSMAGVMLADLGADVIKIESPSGDPGRQLMHWGRVPCMLDDGRSGYFEVFNRGKRGIALNLAREIPRRIAFELAAKADVVMSNFRPGVMERLGLGYDAICAVNPGLIYATATGYGPYGPDRDRPGFEFVGQARSGYMWSMGGEGEPPQFHNVGPNDIGGAIMLAQSVLAGVAGRGLSGKGCKIQTSGIGAIMFLQQSSAGGVFFINGGEMPRARREEEVNPLTTYYECSDGQWIFLGALQTERYWASLCQKFGIPELADDPRFATLEAIITNREQVVAILDEVFAKKTSDDWLKVLAEVPDLVYERIQTLTDVRSDPQYLANEYIMKLADSDGSDRTVIRAPFHVDGHAPRSARRAPLHGEHTWEVLSEYLGYAHDDLVALAMNNDL
jgi:CoA:oxalate CoA-transferase